MLPSVNFIIRLIFTGVFYFWPCISAKLSYFRDLKLGVNIAARGENRDLLNADGERNDYDWYAHLIAHISLVCSMINTYFILASFNRFYMLKQI